jgi:hypothetical protein
MIHELSSAKQRGHIPTRLAEQTVSATVIYPLPLSNSQTVVTPHVERKRCQEPLFELTAMG